jgi:hypothetical protein
VVQGNPARPIARCGVTLVGDDPLENYNQGTNYEGLGESQGGGGQIRVGAERTASYRVPATRCFNDQAGPEMGSV